MITKQTSILYIILFIFFSSCSFRENSHKKIKLNNNWEFTSAKYNDFFPANIPGSVHSDLFKNKLIPNPFSGKNESELQWIDTLEWIYQTEFFKPKDIKPDEQIELLFKGIDTYADVFLNDSLLFSANNMFVHWNIRINQEALKDTNILKIKFLPPFKIESEKYSALPYELPGGSRVVSRKAAYHYGWDWGPKYITSGIWQDIELHYWNTAKISDLNYSIENLDSSSAIVNLHLIIESLKDFKGQLDFIASNQKLKYSFKNIAIQKGVHEYSFKLEIDKPKLWWTKNLGEAFLYRFEAKLINKNQILDFEKINIGLRTIELVREPDQQGESFYFKLNGVPVFIKGANYIPQSSFPGIVTDDQYKNIISDVVISNMNMLRVWGGGIYEKDIFYDLCDENGILIWQDFMFANAMYPSDSLFIENIEKEATFQVNRLKNHPSLAVWCGNNEIDEAWHNWGWSGSYTKKDSAEIWNNYENIFHNILPKIVKETNPKIPYTSSSPLFGRGNPRSSFEGDNHYWYVWHDSYDFDWFNKVTGRFMSEFGFQSFPSLETIEYFDTSKNKRIDSEIMLAHQKHIKGNILINQYMKDYYPFPENFEDYIYISQLLQAEGIRTGILSQRRAKPFCMGSLYWQLNDCWPAISWSSIDYSGNWKALHYFAKEDFKNIIIDPYLKNDSLQIFIVSDSLESINANLKLYLIDFYGQKSFEKELTIQINPNESKIVWANSISELLNKQSKNNHLLHLELLAENKIIDSRNVYFSKLKNIELPDFKIDIKIKHSHNAYEIILESKTLIKNLYIHIPGNGQLSDNFFDLVPNTEKKIIFTTKEKIENLVDLIEYKSLNHILNNK